MASRRRLIGIAVSAIMALPHIGLADVSGPGQAAHCRVEGTNPAFSVVRIEIPGQGRVPFSWGFNAWSTPYLDHWEHTFVGTWIVSEARRDITAYRFYQWGNGRDELKVSGAGQTFVHQALPTNAPTSGVQGSAAFWHDIDVGVYYLVVGGTGTGRYEAWITLGDGRAGVSCEEIEVPGRTIDYELPDFVGGTHVLGPGYGRGDDVRLEFSNPHRITLGGVFVYQPPPAPKPRVTMTTEYGPHTIGSGCIWKDPIICPILWSAKQVRWRATYTGRTDTIGIKAVQLDLPGF